MTDSTTSSSAWKRWKETRVFSFADYQEATAETAIYPESQALEYLALGLASEAGEVAGKVKKLIRDGGDPSGVILGVAGELGDVLWYLARLADEIGISLHSVAEGNLTKLRDRKNRGVIGGSGDSR